MAKVFDSLKYNFSFGVCSSKALIFRCCLAIFKNLILQTGVNAVQFNFIQLQWRADLLDNVGVKSRISAGSDDYVTHSHVKLLFWFLFPCIKVKVKVLEFFCGDLFKVFNSCLFHH